MSLLWFNNNAGPPLRTRNQFPIQRRIWVETVKAVTATHSNFWTVVCLVKRDKLHHNNKFTACRLSSTHLYHGLADSVYAPWPCCHCWQPHENSSSYTTAHILTALFQTSIMLIRLFLCSSEMKRSLWFSIVVCVKLLLNKSKRIYNICLTSSHVIFIV